MARRRGIMSEGFKHELAKDLGFYDVVQREGWSGIRTKDAGNMVKRAIQIAQQHLANEYAAAKPQVQTSHTSYRQPSGYQPIYQGSQASANYTPNYGSNYAQGYASSHTPGYTPAYSSNQPQSVTMNHVIAGSQQSGQGTQRSYYN
ncbi:protein SspF [Paenibacillus roseipurpureus]|uniref:Protein SspF n=1 Tax=Paenibacillus roseopurpureus TaxID=2918901 RepID=A0AA96LML0_9BACL|nr:protein SspF [Paenibacillus sp. MBLB1832]WNR44762.1 protein SspF [Paenibacillus sp. MBLB1832]